MRNPAIDQTCLLFPVLAGRRAAARAFLRQLDHRKRDEYERSRRELSIARQAWFVAEIDGQELLVSHVEAEDFARATKLFAESREPFDLWFKDELAQVTGVDLNEPPALAAAELLSAYGCDDSAANARRHRAAHQAFNRRDFDAMTADVAPSMRFFDPARRITTAGPDEFAALCREEVRLAPDASVEDARYYAAGDAVTARFTSSGTIGAEGEPGDVKRYSLPVLEIAHFDEQGQMVLVEIFYDGALLLEQLGRLEPSQPAPAAAEATRPQPAPAVAHELAGTEADHGGGRAIAPEQSRSGTARA